MIYTARQLESMQKKDGRIVLPYRSRLTPLAADWLRARKITVGYSDAEAATAAPVAAPAPAVADPSAAAYLWWLDGPCGPAKAALAMLGRQTPLRPIERRDDPASLPEVVKFLAAQIKSAQCAGGILMMRSGAAAVVFANRCPSIRAILGTCLDAVDQGVNQLAANVLVIEHPYHSLQQTQNLLSRFTRSKRQLGEDVRRQLQELSSCG